MDRSLLIKSSCYGMMWYFWVGTLVLPAYGSYFSADPILRHGLLLVATVVTLAAYGMIAARGGALFANRRLAFLAAVLLVLSVMFNVAGLDRVIPVPDALLLAFCIGFGVGLGLFAGSQIEFLGSLELREARLSLLVSMSVGIVFLVPMQLMLSLDSRAFGLAESLLTFAVVPFLGFDGDLRCERRTLPEGLGLAGAARPFLRIAPSLFSLGLFLGFFVSNLPSSGDGIVTTVILAAITLLVVAALLKRSGGLSLSAELIRMAKLVSLLGIIGVVLFLVFPSMQGIWLGIVAAGFAAFLLMVMLLCATAFLACDAVDIRPAFAGVLSLSTLGVVAGLLIRCAFGGGLDGYFEVACLVVVSVLAAVATLFLDGRDFGSTRESAASSEGDAVALLFADEEAAADEVGSYCSSIAREYGLTAKQAEVLTYLALGRTAKSIAKSLGNSEGTIRGHINQIYTKLDVHSRDELEMFFRKRYARPGR